MTEHLANTVKLMTAGQKVNYIEEKTLGISCYADDEESEEEEELRLER